VQLPAKDFDLAALLLRNVGQLLSRRCLRQAMSTRDVVLSSRALDTHVSRVRNGLKLKPEHGWRLEAVYTAMVIVFNSSSRRLRGPVRKGLKLPESSHPSRTDAR
jgi:hypothetical protein